MGINDGGPAQSASRSHPELRFFEVFHTSPGNKIFKSKKSPRIESAQPRTDNVTLT